MRSGDRLDCDESEPFRRLRRQTLGGYQLWGDGYPVIWRLAGE